MKSSYFVRKNSRVLIKKCETGISIKKGSVSLFIKITEFSLTLAWIFIFPKVQVLSLEQVVIDFDMRKQKSLGPGFIYRTITRVEFVIIYIA